MPFIFSYMHICMNSAHVGLHLLRNTRVLRTGPSCSQGHVGTLVSTPPEVCGVGTRLASGLLLCSAPDWPRLKDRPPGPEHSMCQVVRGHLVPVQSQSPAGPCSGRGEGRGLPPLVTTGAGPVFPLAGVFWTGTTLGLNGDDAPPPRCHCEAHPQLVCCWEDDKQLWGMC